MKTILNIVLSSFVAILLSGFANVTEANLTNFSANSQTANVSNVEQYIYRRVLIDSVWWIYVYTLDGSFVTAFPDEDE